MHPVCDYLSLHLYASTQPGKPASLFSSIASMEEKIVSTSTLIKSLTPEKVEHFPKWYRFPSRQHPVKIALDEWGIWESGGSGAYDLEVKYNWNHALGVATFFNIFHRHADMIGLATWAQTVNVLAPIMTNDREAACQTIYYPMLLYRQLCGDKSVRVKLDTPATDGIPALDVAATINEKEQTLIVSIVNRDPHNDIDTVLDLPAHTYMAHVLNAPSITAMGKDVVSYKKRTLKGNKYIVPAHSITLLQVPLNH
jgi:alpha-N-arabinofuranosidase